MIKLIDDIRLLERLSEKEPYFGSLFNAAAVSFMDDPELLSIWVETDEHGDAHSFLNASTDSLMLFSPYGVPGFETVLFVTNLVSGGTIKNIECDENSFGVLRNLFDFDIENAVQMFAENRIDMPKNAFDVHDFANFDDAWEVTKNLFGKEEDSVKDFWKLKMVRGVLRKQSTLLTLHDGAAVSTACIRGRTEKAGAITSVVTLPEHRKKGYASYLTALCTNMLIDEHRVPWLVPANEKVRKMYEKLGYKAAKNYYYLYNIKEKEDRK
ncbi:MAG: GNAT family N-acetyltransferase [Oscillospiraceae bacterium]|nr:GNAT family N-acetyltransferase [Oscillospiraceae bacterium]